MAAGSPNSFDLNRVQATTLGRRLHFFEALESTNTYALEQARSQAFSCPALVLAERQTGGRGRGSNRWWSDHGGLTFSLVLEPPREFDRTGWPRIALTAAVAICHTVSAKLSGATSGIRWPNDVFVGEHKISGVLVEVPALAETRQARVVVGVGLNVNNKLSLAPCEVRQRATSLCELLGRDLSLSDVLATLLEFLDRDLHRLYIDDSSLISEWQELCLLRGREVTLEQGPRRIVGRCVGIHDDGALLLSSSGQVERLYGGVLTRVN